MQQAEKSYKSALVASRACAYPHGIQAALGNLGNVYALTGEQQKALDMYRKQEQKCAQTFNHDGQNSALTGQFVIALKLGDLDRCDQILERQTKICGKYGNTKGMELAMGNRAVLAYKRGLLDETRRLLGEKLRLAEETGHFEGQLNALTNLADLCYEEERIPQAVDHGEKAVRLCRRNRNKEQLHHALVRLSFFYEKNDQQDKADIASAEAVLIEQTHGVLAQDSAEKALMISQK